MILSKTFDVTGQVGDAPRTVRMVVTDSLVAVTTAGYLNQQLLFPDYLYPSDFVDMRYNVNPNIPGSGTNNIFTVSIVDNVITLNQFSNNGNVVLPVISGHFANFEGTNGNIGDIGLEASNPTNAVVPTLPEGTYGVGTWPIFADAAGSLKTAINSNITQTNTTSNAAPTDSLISLFLNFSAATLTVNNALGVGAIYGQVTANIVNNSVLAGLIGSVTTVGNGTGSNTVSGIEGRLNIGGGSATTFPGVYAAVAGEIQGTLTAADNPNVYGISLKNQTSNRIAAYFNASGTALNFMNLATLGDAVSTPAGGTPGGALRQLSVLIDGVQYFILCAASFS